MIKKTIYLNVAAMNHKSVKSFESDEETLHEELSESLKSQAGYILITCGQPSESGQMNVEMSYGGNPDLVHMLLEGAQELLSEEEEEAITPF